jgi:hypothetical protein
MNDDTNYFVVFFIGVFGGVISTIFFRLYWLPAFKGITKMSRRRIKRKRQIDWVEIFIDDRIARIPRSDVSLFIAENMEFLSEKFGLEMPPQCTAIDKKANIGDLSKIADFMADLQRICLEKQIIRECNGGKDET